MSKTLFVPQNLYWEVDGSGTLGASGSARPNIAYIKSQLDIDSGKFNFTSPVSGTLDGKLTIGPNIALYRDSGGTGILQLNPTSGINGIASGGGGISVYSNGVIRMNVHAGEHWELVSGSVHIPTASNNQGIKWSIPTGLRPAITSPADATLRYDSSPSGGGTNPRHEFYIDGVEKWRIDSSGNLIAGTDGVVNIGASAATRPLDIHLKRALAFEQTTTPANPAANNFKLYFKSDGFLYRLDSSGLETQVGSSTPAGSDTQVQFNDAGVFGGDAGLTYNKTTDTLSVGTKLSINSGVETSGLNFRMVGGTLTLNNQAFANFTGVYPATAGINVTGVNFGFSRPDSPTDGTLDGRIRAVIISNRLLGFTGSANTNALEVTNRTRSTKSLGWQDGNIAGFFEAANDASSIGEHNAVQAIAGFGTKLIGVMGAAINSAATGTTHIGVQGAAYKSTTANAIGGYFRLGTDIGGALITNAKMLPSTFSAALAADNGASTSDILILQDNGTNVWQVIDGGNLLASTDGGVSIGNASTNRPNNVYVKSFIGINSGSGAKHFSIAGDTVDSASPALIKVTGTSVGATNGIDYLGFDLDLTTAGAATSIDIMGQRIKMRSGYSGSVRTRALSVENLVGSTQAVQLVPRGNIGGYFYATGGTEDVAVMLEGNGGSKSWGLLSVAHSNAGSGQAMGVGGFAVKNATSTSTIGGFFKIVTDAVDFTTTAFIDPTVLAAIVADNGDVAADIARFRDNGTNVFRIQDGGAVSITPSIATGNIISIATTSTDGTNPSINITNTINGSADEARGMTVLSNGSYTGTSTTSSHALYAVNTRATQGVNFPGRVTMGLRGEASAVTTGTMAGIVTTAEGGNVSVGGFLSAVVAKASASNIGVIGIAANTGAGGNAVAGHFRLFEITGGSTYAYTESANSALIADNGIYAVDIAKFRDNGTDVFRIQDGGFVNGTATVPNLASSYRGYDFSLVVTGTTLPTRIIGHRISIGSGYTGSGSTRGLEVSNESIAGSSALSFSNPDGHYGITIFTAGNGEQAGILAQASDGAKSWGVVGQGISNVSGAYNVGVNGSASIATAGSPRAIGGFFRLETNGNKATLYTTDLSAFSSAAMLATNGSTTSDIAALYDNTTRVFRFKDGGVFELEGSSGANIIWTTSGGGNVGLLAGNRPDGVYAKSFVQVGGVSNPLSAFDKLLVVSDNNPTLPAMIANHTYNNADAQGGRLVFRRARGTEASPTSPLSGDHMGLIYVSGETGGGQGASAEIRFQATENWSGGNRGTKFVINTYANAGGPAADRWEVAHNGHLLASTDGAVDIGASAANRPNNLFIKNIINLDTLTANRLVATDASKNLISTTVDTSEFGYLEDTESLTTVNLNDNQAAAADIATWAHASYRSINIFYSISRGAGNVETGTVKIATDGTTVGYDQQSASIGTSGVTLTVDINGANVRLRYTSTSTGTAPVFKYKLHKWLA